MKNSARPGSAVYHQHFVFFVWLGLYNQILRKFIWLIPAHSLGYFNATLFLYQENSPTVWRWYLLCQKNQRWLIWRKINVFWQKNIFMVYPNAGNNYILMDVYWYLQPLSLPNLRFHILRNVEIEYTSPWFSTETLKCWKSLHGVFIFLTN